MKKLLIFTALSIIIFAGCDKMETTTVTQEQPEITLSLNSNETGYLRDLQISAYHCPQNGEHGNYFVDKTYAHDTASEDGIWVNWENGRHTPIYWPVDGTLDFLAYSVSEAVNVGVAWNTKNAASQVVLTVPGGNGQNDILFASAYGAKAPSTAIPMQFCHSQSWLEFALTGSPEREVILKRIELEDVYDAGTLTIDNNNGNASAIWDFSEELKKNVKVDNLYDVDTLHVETTKTQFLDMLIPEQTMTAFVLYYTLGNDPRELSYRFVTNHKTWLKGIKYIYKIDVSRYDVIVEPSKAPWEAFPVADID